MLLPLKNELTCCIDSPELGDRASVETMLELSFDAAQPVVLRLAALNALKRLEHPDIPRRLLTHWSILGEITINRHGRIDGTHAMDASDPSGGAGRPSAQRRCSHEVLVRLEGTGGGNAAQTLIREIWGRMRQPEETKQRRMGSGKDPSGDRWACRCR